MLFTPGNLKEGVTEEGQLQHDVKVYNYNYNHYI